VKLSLCFLAMAVAAAGCDSPTETPQIVPKTDSLPVVVRTHARLSRLVITVVRYGYERTAGAGGQRDGAVDRA
jgi:hypothetical protein